MNIRNIPGWAQMTGEELYIFCLTHPNTTAPILTQDLRNWLADHRFAWLNRNNSWVGPLADIIEDAPEEAAIGLDRLFSHLSFPTSQIVDTDKDSYSGLLLFVMNSLSPSESQLNEFYSMSGGRKYPLFGTVEQAIKEQEDVIAKDLRDSNIKATRELFAGISGVILDKLHKGEISIWDEVVAIVEAAG